MSDKIIVPQNNLIHFIDPESILYCKSENNYTSIITITGKTYLVVKSLAKFSKELNTEIFIRVNQSFIVNKNFINIIDKKRKYIELSGDTTVPFTIKLKDLLALV